MEDGVIVLHASLGEDDCSNSIQKGDVPGSGVPNSLRPTSKAFVEALWNTPVPSGEQRYYDGMLYLMSLLHCSGSFRIIEPQEVNGGAPGN